VMARVTETKLNAGVQLNKASHTSQSDCLMAKKA